MKIVCKRNILLNAINIVSKAVPSRTTSPILECILLTADAYGFKMTANDMELAIETRLNDVEIIEAGNVALEAKIFSEMIRYLPEDDICIEVDSNNQTNIKCSSCEYKISGQAGELFPALPEVIKNLEYTLQQSQLRDMIRQTLFSVSKEETKPTLTGELLEIIDSNINLVAIDGFRVAFRKSELTNESQDIKAIIPGNSLSEINKILSNEEEYEVSLYFTDKHVLFDLGDTTIVSRVIEGEFMNYEQVFSDEYTTKVQADRKSLIMGLERAALLARENKKTPVKVDISENELEITSNTELGTAYEKLEVKTEGTEIVIAFNPKYLIDALKAIDDDIVAIYFTSSLSPCIIKPIEGDTYKYLVLPVKLNV